MIITDDFLRAQRAEKIEFFGLADGTYCVITGTEDYDDPSLPQEVRDRIAARSRPPAPIVPQSITRFAGLMTLDDFSLSANFKAWANSPDRSFREQVFIFDSPNWRRDDETLIAAAQALGVSEQLDAMFIHAAKYDSGDSVHA